MQALPPLTFASWTRALSARGYGVLPASHAVPVSLWLRDADHRVGQAGCCTTRPAAPGCDWPRTGPRPDHADPARGLRLRGAPPGRGHRPGRPEPGSRAARGARARRREGVRLARPRSRPAPPAGDRRNPGEPPPRLTPSTTTTTTTTTTTRTTTTPPLADPSQKCTPTAPRRHEGAPKPRRAVVEVHPDKAPSRRGGAPGVNALLRTGRSTVSLHFCDGSAVFRCTSGTGRRGLGATMRACGSSTSPRRRTGNGRRSQGAYDTSTRGRSLDEEGFLHAAHRARCRESSSGTTRTCASRWSCSHRHRAARGPVAGGGGRRRSPSRTSTVRSHLVPCSTYSR